MMEAFFDTLDDDNTGTVSVDDFLANAGYMDRNSEDHFADAATIIALFDLDDDGELRMSEINALSKNLPEWFDGT